MALYGPGAIYVSDSRLSRTPPGHSATPQGQMPATGRSVSIPFSTFMEIEGERITAQRAYWDQVAFMAQLGLMPEGPSA